MLCGCGSPFHQGCYTNGTWNTRTPLESEDLALRGDHSVRYRGAPLALPTEKVCGPWGGQWCPSSVPRLWSGLGVPLSISTQTMELLWHTDSLPLEDRHAWMDGHFFISKRELYWKKDYTYSIESTEQTSKKLFFKYVKRKMLYEFQNYISVTGLFHKAKLGCERICQSNVFCVHFHFHSLFYFFSEWKYNNTSVIKKIINAPTVTVSWSSPLKHNQPSFYCITFCLESAF